MTQRLDGAKSHNIFHAISPMFVDFCALIMSIKKEQRHLEINSTLHCLIFLRKKKKNYFASLVSRLKELKTTLHGNHGQGRNSDTGRSAGQQ